MPADWRPAFRTLRHTLEKTLPADLRAFQWGAHSWQAKAWYGNRDLHYEIWVRASAKVVELGLHFEADALTNARLLAAFRGRAREVTRGLGADARIEEWDKGWSRVWEPFPFSTPDLEERVCARFCEYVRVLEPILRDELPSDVEWREAPTRRPRATAASRGSAGRQQPRSGGRRSVTSSRASR